MIHVLHFYLSRMWPGNFANLTYVNFNSRTLTYLLTYVNDHYLTVASSVCLDLSEIQTNILWDEILFLSCMTYVRDFPCYTYVCLHVFNFFTFLIFPLYFSSSFTCFWLLSRTWHYLTYVNFFLTYVIIVSFINTVASVFDQGPPRVRRYISHMWISLTYVICWLTYVDHQLIKFFILFIIKT